MDLARQEALRAAYGRRRPGYRPASHLYAEWVQAEGRRRPPVLDVGCGRFGVLGPLDREGVPVIGFDPDEEAVGQNRQLRCRLVAGLPRLPLAEESFGTLAMGWVLEHLADPAAGLAALRQILQPGGSLLFLTPNLRHPLVAANRLLAQPLRDRVGQRLYGRGRQEIYPPTYRANSPARIERLFGQAGFQRVRLEAVGDPSYWAFGLLGWWLGLAYEALTDRWPGFKIHLVGWYRRPAEGLD